MDGGFVAAFSTIGVLVVVNIATFAYGYGKLNQKVKDQGDRLTRIENTLNNMPKNKTKK